ncbi:hypothetical protein Skr01_47850 [Sphaerisporangium krabiense]|nr:hypothetical protein Skr01_47850 [Sphaerisporangium krabiense]
MMENEIASGMSARATTRPDRISVRATEGVSQAGRPGRGRVTADGRAGTDELGNRRPYMERARTGRRAACHRPWQGKDGRAEGYGARPSRRGRQAVLTRAGHGGQQAAAITGMRASMFLTS